MPTGSKRGAHVRHHSRPGAAMVTVTLPVAVLISAISVLVTFVWRAFRGRRCWPRRSLADRIYALGNAFDAAGDTADRWFEFKGRVRAARRRDRELGDADDEQSAQAS